MNDRGEVVERVALGLGDPRRGAGHSGVADVPRQSDRDPGPVDEVFTRRQAWAAAEERYGRPP
jgi:hypothetical protein